MERLRTRFTVSSAGIGPTRRSLVLRQVPVLLAAVLTGKVVAG